MIQISLTLVIFFAFCTYIIIQYINKIRARYISINKSYSVMTVIATFIIVTFFLSAAVLSLKHNTEEFVGCYKEVSVLLIPKYLSSHMEMFDYSKIRDLLYKSESVNHYKDLRVSTYLLSLKTFLKSLELLLGCVMISLALLNSTKSAIARKGIYTRSGLYKWNRVNSYKWGNFKIKRNGIGYYELLFELKPSKRRIPILTRLKNMKINIHIKKEDKHNITNFLEFINIHEHQACLIHRNKTK